MSNLEQIKEEIAIDLISTYGYILESEGEEAANEWLSSLTEEQLVIMNEGVLDTLDTGAEIIVPFYGAGKKALKGDYSGAVKDAATDFGLMAAGGIAGKLAKGAYTAYQGAKAAKAAAKAVEVAKKGSDVGSKMANVRNPSAIAKDVALPPSSIKPGPSMPKPANDVAAKMATATSKGADDAVKLATHTSRISKAKEVAKRFVEKPVTAGVAAGAAASSVNRTSNAQQPSSGVELSKALAANPAPKPAAPAAAPAAAKPAGEPAATPAATSATTKSSSDSTKKKTTTPSQRTSSARSSGSGSFGYHGTKTGTAPADLTPGQLGNRLIGAVYEDHKPDIKDFRILQERIMRKNNGSF